MRVYLPIILLFGLTYLAGLPGRAAAESTVVLTNAAQIRALSPAQAAQRLPVRLKGIVTTTASWNALVIMDQTAGIYVTANHLMSNVYQRGDEVEIEGVTDPGEFAPFVRVKTDRKTGTAPVPSPQPTSYRQIMTGAEDAQWIQFTGVVRKFSKPADTNGISRMEVAADGGSLQVRFNNSANVRIDVDAEVCVQAICYYQVNLRRQVLNPVLQIPVGVPVRVVQPAPADPFAAPFRSAESLLQFSPASSFDHRVHVRGLVTCHQAGGPRLIWIRDGSTGLKIQLQQDEDLQPGDQIEVLGFPRLGAYTPMLEEAMVKKTGVTRPPAPQLLANPREVFDHEDDLVTLTNTLTGLQSTFEGVTLSLESGGQAFKAYIQLPGNDQAPPAWEPGSIVRVTGIGSIIYDESKPMMGVWYPQSFQILLRAPNDLTVITPPPWWTPRHVMLVLCLVAGGSVLATALVMWQARRRLAEQGRQRALAETQFTAILAERNRVAREIHDTLAQGLVATSVQLRLARKQIAGVNPGLTAHLDTALQLVQGSLQEARNSIWNMRSQVLETGDLAGALKNILRQMSDGTELRTEFETIGKPRRFSPFIENNLLRVGQEAITNAIKHAQAGQIKVTVEFGEKQFCLTVTDDGRGFDAAQPPPSEGGFGQVGMRERANALKGTLAIRSAPGQGAQIRLTVPLTGD